jgi:hypothetical protein
VNHDDIIRLAREAGLIHYHDSEGHWTGVTNDNLIEVEENRWDDKLVRILQPFAALVAAAEREACAKACDQLSWKLNDDITKAAFTMAADTIRARGEK